MQIKTFFLPLVGAAIVLLASCNKNAVTLSYTNAKGEVPQLGNLVFRFSNTLAKDSMLDAWDSTEYISFSPAIPGKFRWQGPDELIFSPAEPLRPATKYTAKIKSAALKFSKYDAVKGGDKVSFHTPALQLTNSHVYWIGESSTTATPQIDLYFNYQVSPTDLKDKLEISIDGKSVPYTMITLSPDSKISIRATGLKIEDRDIEAAYVIKEGLKPEKGNTATEDAVRGTITIPSAYVLTIQSIESEHDGVEGVVRVSTSQQLTGESLHSFLKVDPHITYSTDHSEYGFTIRSDKFDTEKSYVLNIMKGLRGKIGGVMKEDFSGSVAFGELESGITFTSSKAVYLSKNGGKNIEVSITNVPKVKLIISKVYENNLLLAQQYGYEPRETRSGPDFSSYSDYEEGYYDDYRGSDAMLGDVIFEKEVDTRSLPKSGGGRLLNISQFEDRLGDFKGVYHVVIRSTEDYWVRDSRYISLSDIGLITKEDSEKIYVFANSIKTANPLSAVNVAVYSSNNQLIGSGTTGKEGTAEINYTRKEFSGFKPAMIIAKTADDFNYMPFTTTRVNTSRFDVGGKRANPSGLDAFIYAERDVYRPGEKINFSVIIRDALWKSPGDIPIKIKILMPNGKELKTFRKGLNEEGSVEGNHELSISAITGSYTLEVFTTTDVLLATKNFSVEEFVPDRIKVIAKLQKESLRSGDKTNLLLNATNFFGPPAANRKFEAEIQVRQKYFKSPKYEDYDFSLTNTSSVFDKQLKDGITDVAGNAVIEYEVPATYQDMGVLQTTFYSTVFDETGRPVSRAVSADIFTQDIFYGIKQDWFYYYPLNQAVKIQLASVNKEGNSVNSVAKIEVIKHEYRTVLTKSGSYFRYESQRDDKIMETQQITVGGNTVYSYIPRSPGDYEIRISRPGGSSYVRRTFYSYGNYGGNTNSFEVSNEGSIEIETDKKVYASGEKVKALFKTPFNGRLLVTMETDHVLSHHYIDVVNRNASLDLKLTGEHIPNVYITATLFKAHGVSDIPLTVAHGFKNVTVEDKERKIPVQVTAQQNVRSKTRQKVTVKATPGSFITLSAVDNGVLQVSDFKTPDPYAHFYEKKALHVLAYDLYPLLFAEVRSRLSSTGGDGEMDMDKRINPMPAKRIKVVSYWGGIKKANANGTAEFEFDVPQFSGELRLMAVAYKGNSFGAGDKTMTVADPIVVSTALPRFLSPGDTVSVPVTLTNTTTKNANVNASIDVEGPMKIVGSNKQALTLPAQGEQRVTFRIASDRNIALGKLKITVNGMGELFTDVTEISVRPPSTLQKTSGSGSIAGGNSQKITIGLSDFMAGSSDYKLVVSRSPVIELGEHLKYLVQYPYGCTEQTISSAFPQLYYGDLASLVQQGKSSVSKTENANTNILEAIRKIRMRQLYTGALTMWDGEGREDWWTTIYGAHFLFEAKKAGFEVDNNLLGTMLNYISIRLKNKETITYYYNRDQNKKIAPKEVAYGLYVLALAGRTNVPSMNYYKANTALLALDSRYLLAAAYATAGDKKSFATLLPSAFAGEESVPQTGGSFYSDIRDEAISLNALIDVDPANAQIGVMVKHVAAKLKSRKYLSTQERSFSFLALGKHARLVNNSTVTAEINVNGKTIAKVDGGQWAGSRSTLGSLIKDNNPTFDLVTKGQGRLYYFWEAEGISTTGGYKEEDSYLKVRKQFFDRNGNKISGNSFSQNDLIIVGITLERSYTTPVENIVITDILPAGFEIENPRTKEIPGMDWIKDASSPTSLDVRDDRIHFFVDANSKRQTYYYAVRAVSPGIFKMGPVSADAMYNGEYHSYHGAGVVKITQ